MTWPRTVGIIGCLGLLAALTIAAGTVIRGCKSAHSRPLGQDDMTVSASPDGRTLVVAANGLGGRDLYLLDLITNQVRLIAATPEYETAPRFSPDGNSIVYTAGRPGDRADHIYVRNLKTNTTTQLTSIDANDCTPMFSADGKHIIFARDTHYNWGGLAASWSGGGEAWSIDANGSHLTRLLPEKVFTESPRISPDGKKIVWWAHGAMIANLDGVDTGHAMYRGNARDVDFSPRGDSLVFVDGQYSGDQKLFVLRLSTKRLTNLTAAGTGCNPPTISHDGRTLYYEVESWPNGYIDAGPAYALWKIGADGRNPLRIASSALFTNPLAWKPGQ